MHLCESGRWEQFWGAWFVGNDWGFGQFRAVWREVGTKVEWKLSWDLGNLGGTERCWSAPFLRNEANLGGVERFWSALLVESELGLGNLGGTERCWSAPFLGNGENLGGVERSWSALVVGAELGFGQTWAV